MFYVYQKLNKDEDEVKPVNLEEIVYIRKDYIEYSDESLAYFILFKHNTKSAVKEIPTSVRDKFIPLYKDYVAWKYENKEDRDKEFKRLLLIFDALAMKEMYVKNQHSIDGGK